MEPRCLARARTHHQLLIGDASPTPGFSYIGHHPARAVLVAAVRVLRTFSFWQPLRIGNHESRRKWFDALGLAIYYPLLALAVIGLWRLKRGRWLLLAPVYTTLLGHRGRVGEQPLPDRRRHLDRRAGGIRVRRAKSPSCPPVSPMRGG